MAFLKDVIQRAKYSLCLRRSQGRTERPEEPTPGGRLPQSSLSPGAAGSPAWPPGCEHFPKEEMQAGRGLGGAASLSLWSRARQLEVWGQWLCRGASRCWQGHRGSGPPALRGPSPPAVAVVVGCRQAPDPTLTKSSSRAVVCVVSSYQARKCVCGERF